MLKVVLSDPDNGSALQTRPIAEAGQKPKGDERVLEVAQFSQVHGTFKSATRTGAGTTTIVSPDADGSLIITDIMISGEKQAGSSVEIRFTDGTDSAVMFLASQVDAPPQLAHSFLGRVQGWKDARIDMVTAGAGDATVLVCYTKIPSGLPYEEWDALR
jgi:hypothetical protein